MQLVFNGDPTSTSDASEWGGRATVSKSFFPVVGQTGGAFLYVEQATGAAANGTELYLMYDYVNSNALGINGGNSFFDVFFQVTPEHTDYVVRITNSALAAFDDFERWRRYCECPSDHLLSVGGRRCVFANTALFFAWHFTNADEPRIQVQARIVLGLDPRIAQLLRRISLPKLMEIAPHVGSTMRPRWLKHPRFWPDLISTASQRSPNKLRAVRLLGRQMLAAEALRTAEGSIHPVNNKAASK